jgi:predicted Ser/Thr protein kinase
MKKDELINKIAKESSPFRESSDETLYASYHFDNLNIEKSQRNTLRRFQKFAIENDLSGNTIIDLGSCTGALLFEAMRRGAKSGVGYEYSEKKVETSKDIAKHLKVDAEFVKMDFTKELPNNKADIVFACAIDGHIGYCGYFYNNLFDITIDTCYFESNRNDCNSFALKEYFENMGWGSVMYMGLSDDDAYPRMLFMLKKKKPFKKSLDCYNFLKNNTIVKIFRREKDYLFQKELYEKIKHIKYVPEMDYSTYNVCKRKYAKEVLSEMALNNQDKLIYKTQIIDFIRQLNLVGISHGDLHSKNIVVEQGQIYVIDWEHATYQNEIFENCYDLTGNGNLNKWGGYVFSETIGYYSLNKRLNISKEDIVN